MEAYVAPKPLRMNGPFTDVQVNHAMCTNTRFYGINNNPDSSFPLQPRGHDAHDFQKQPEM